MSTSPGDWRAIVGRIDRGAALAIDQDIARREISPCEIVEGFRQLTALRRGLEPDYGVRGVATAYAFLYLVQRAASIAALLSSELIPRKPVRILDLGAGCGALALALDALGLRDCEVVAVEPSAEMRAFPLMKPGARLTVLKGTREDIADRSLDLPGTFDVILLSACFPYGWPGSGSRVVQTDFALALRPWLKPGGLVLGIEPAAKHAVADAVAEGLRLGDYSVRAWALDLEQAFPRLAAAATSKLLEERSPAIRKCRAFDYLVDDLIGPPWLIETAAKQPDVVYAAIPVGLASGQRRTPQPSRAETQAAATTAHAAKRPDARWRRRIRSLAESQIALGAALLAATAFAAWLALTLIP